MRPEKAAYLLEKALLAACQGDGDYLPLDSAISAIKRLHKKCLSDNDHRSGYETYGYGDREACIWQLFYISDRFMCQFRLRWLLDGIENREFERILAGATP